MPSSTITSLPGSSLLLGDIDGFAKPDLTKVKFRPEGDISAVFASLESGTIENAKLDAKYSEIKKRLVKNPEAVKQSWLRLKESLKQEIDQIETLYTKAIPEVEFKDLDILSEAQKSEIYRRGCVVVKNVFDRTEARKFKTDVEEYVRLNPQTKGFPAHKKVVYELYWSKSQLKARAAPAMRKTLKWMNNLWHAEPTCEVSLDHNLSYADRLRIRQAGDDLFSLGPHSDGGGIERWEDDEYSKCYQPIWEGRWEEYDPYDATHRVTANMDLYDGVGGCSAFRTFQGWLAMSEVKPNGGTILFAPLVKEVTAYLCLRPFFDENDNLVLDSPKFPGTTPGKAQEYNTMTHPDLDLSRLMTPVPPVAAGDAVFWHCDLIHSVDPVHTGDSDSSVMYIPSTPLCAVNTNLAFVQRESFLRGIPGPDFPGFPNGVGESQHKERGTPHDVLEVGGEGGLQEFGLRPIPSAAGSTPGAVSAIRKFNHLLFGMDNQ